jgi:perosamine synthetase
LQAAIGCGQLERIDEIIQSHIRIERGYKESLSDSTEIEWQKDFENTKRVVWLVTALVKNREEIVSHCKDNHVDIRPFFYPLSAMPVYHEFAKADCPNAKKLSALGINLPTVEGVSSEVYNVIKQASSVD